MTSSGFFSRRLKLQNLFFGLHKPHLGRQLCLRVCSSWWLPSRLRLFLTSAAIPNYAFFIFGRPTSHLPGLSWPFRFPRGSTHPEAIRDQYSRLAVVTGEVQEALPETGCTILKIRVCCPRCISAAVLMGVLPKAQQPRVANTLPNRAVSSITADVHQSHCPKSRCYSRHAAQSVPSIAPPKAHQAQCPRNSRHTAH